MSLIKPFFGAYLNAAHPHAYGLRLALLLNEACGNRVFDLSRNLNHGTLVNMTPANSWVGGRNGYALNFGGIGSDDYINVPYNETLNLSSGLTIEAVINPSNVTGVHIIAGKPYTTTHSSPFFDWLLAINNDKLVIRVGTSTADGTENSIAVDTVYHVACTITGQTYYKIFINGILDIAEIDSALPSNTNSQDIRIGANRANNEEFDGQIGFVRIYDRPKTDLEILQVALDPYAMFRPNISLPFGIAAAGHPIISQYGIHSQILGGKIAR